jgi:hypothetical protein
MATDTGNLLSWHAPRHAKVVYLDQRRPAPNTTEPGEALEAAREAALTPAAATHLRQAVEHAATRLRIPANDTRARAILHDLARACYVQAHLATVTQLHPDQPDGAA